MYCPLCMMEAPEKERKALKNGEVQILSKCILHGFFYWLVSEGTKRFVCFEDKKDNVMPCPPTPKKTFADRCDYSKRNQSYPRAQYRWVPPKKRPDKADL